MNVEGITFTKHARERYAERIMGRDNARDINTFVSEHSEKIEQDICKMIEFGDELYVGKPSFNNPKNHSCVYIIKDFWIIVIDSFDNKVITLYKIDLGAGEDIDKAFRDRLLEKINYAKDVAAETKMQIDTEAAVYKKIISDNMDTISDLRRQIKNLEAINEAYSSTLDAASKRKAMADDTVKKYVATLVGRTSF